MQLKEASILIVDDEPALLEIMAAWIRPVAHAIFSAGDGVQALQILSTNQIDLIITDVRMPVLNGIELLKRVKVNELHAPSVIFVSGFTDIEARELYDLGAETLLEKPVEYADLIDAAKRSLADRNELWQVSLDLAACPTLTGSFENLVAALAEHRIAFGRGGFCIETEQIRKKGRVNIELRFKADQYELLGQGIVRWLAYSERQAGIEFTFVAEQSRERAVQFARQSVSFIPSTTGHRGTTGAGCGSFFGRLQ